MNNIEQQISALKPAAQKVAHDILDQAKKNKGVAQLDLSDEKLSIEDSDQIAGLADGDTKLFVAYVVYHKNDTQEVANLQATLNPELLTVKQ